MIALPASGMVFYSTGDANYNTTAPTGALANSGWQWMGCWGGFQGAPIDAHHFLAANHVGGNIGDLFTFQGANYTTVASFVDSASDLRIWEVHETFPAWATIYTNSDEVGRGLVVFGRGVTRGAEVRTAVAIAGVPVNSLAGWQWGGIDGRLRWGQNTVAGVVAGTPFGVQLYATFDENGGANECHLGTGDSSGPVFINDGTAWKLAGVAGLVDSYFNTTNSGSGFNACIFDARGLYYGNGSSWSLVTGTAPKPSGFYATRVSVRTAWIGSILAMPATVIAPVTLGNLNQIYDGGTHPVTVTTFPAGLTVSIIYAGSSTVPVDAGSYAVKVIAIATGYFGSASGTLNIAQASQMISFGALSPVTAGVAPFQISATASSGLPVSFASSDLTVATVSGSTVTVLAAGSTTITAAQAGNTDYLPASSVSQVLVVNPSNPGGNGSGDGSGDETDTPLFSALQTSLFLTLLAGAGIASLRRFPFHSRSC
jgi:hypothetical protein